MSEDIFKNILIVDIDSSRKESVKIGKPEEAKEPESPEEFAEIVINDMASLCEAICTLIHLAESQGIKSSANSLRDCIKHLEAGFSDASYKGYPVNSKFKKEKK